MNIGSDISRFQGRKLRDMSNDDQFYIDRAHKEVEGYARIFSKLMNESFDNLTKVHIDDAYLESAVQEIDAVLDRWGFLK